MGGGGEEEEERGGASGWARYGNVSCIIIINSNS